MTWLERLPFILLIVTLSFALFCIRVTLTAYTERIYSEAGLTDWWPFKFLRLLSSPVILLPVGLASVATGAFTYMGILPDPTFPWWLCVIVGLEMIGEGVDTLVRSWKLRRP